MTELQVSETKKSKRKKYNRRPKTTECICPKCEQVHKLELRYWSGKIPARKFCKECQELIELYNNTIFTFGYISANEKIPPSDFT